MKNIKLFFVLVLAAGVLFAQSDYEKVETFKKKISEIRSGITTAGSLTELDSLQESIADLKKEYSSDKPLLDQSLYPDDYSSVFAKLQTQLDLRRGDFSTIENLQTEVTTLKTELQQLNEKNTELLNRINEFKNLGGKDAKSLAELKKLVNNLKQSLRERDELVRSLVDSLLADFVKHPMTLNDAEKQQIYESVETGNLFYNIEKTIRDNIDFIKATQLSPEDLGEVKEDQVQFYNLWKKIGPKLADVYMNKKEKTGEVAYITNLFSQWNQKVDAEIWDRVKQVFREYKVEITSFSDGNEFTQSVITYLSDGKINGTEDLYITFKDSVWTEELKTKWFPILIDNEMLTTAQRDEMQAALDDWGDLYKKGTPIYWYVAIAIIVIVFLLIFVPKWRSKNKPLAQQ